jgi:chromatin segregation and condensation protein Rec8/ScpA/Scc1 (kleisin family)
MTPTLEGSPIETQTLADRLLAARRAAAPAATRREAINAALRAEMQRLEDRVTARLEKHEKSTAETTMRASDQWNAVTAKFKASEGRIGAIEVKLAEAILRLEKSNEAQAVSLESAQTSLAQTDNLVGRVLETMETVQESIKKLEAGDALKDLAAELAALKAGLAALQQGVEGNAARFTTLERSTEAVQAQLAEKIQTLEKENDIQASSIESIRASAAQTDDLVGRVVEAMETIQDSVLQQVGG